MKGLKHISVRWKCREAKKEDTEKLAKAQALKDATMGWSIAQNIGSYFVHLNGSFHSANQAWNITYLNRYRPGLK